MNWKRKKTAKEIAILIAKGIAICIVVFVIELAFFYMLFA